MVGSAGVWFGRQPVARKFMALALATTAVTSIAACAVFATYDYATSKARLVRDGPTGSWRLTLADGSTCKGQLLWSPRRSERARCMIAALAHVDVPLVVAWIVIVRRNRNGEANLLRRLEQLPQIRDRIVLGDARPEYRPARP